MTGLRRYIILTILVCGTLALITHPAFLGVIFGFLFLGIIPGTSFSIPFWIMLPASLLIGFLAVHWIMHQPMYIGSMEYQEKTARALARKNVAKKIAKHRASLQPKTVATPKKQYRTVKT